MNMQLGTRSAALFLGFVMLAACGGGGSSPEPEPPAPPPTPNQLPVANAGPDQTVSSGASVQLTAAASSDPDGSIASYQWIQTSGPTVLLSSNGVQAPTFTAPLAAINTNLTFVLSVTDNRGGTSAASDFVVITVLQAPNQLPTANAGADQIVLSAATVQLTGVGSSDPDGSIATYAWTQTSGTAVALSNAAAVSPTFTSPTVASNTTLTFSLTVTDNRGGVSAAADSVSITVVPATNVTVSGVITFARVPMVAGGAASLDYLNTRQDPARGIAVQALNATNSTVLASATTDATGAYSMIVPGGTSIKIRALPIMTRLAPLALPHWNFRVRDVGGNLDYNYDDTAFTTGATNVTRNVAIPSGFNAATRQTNGPRSAAPFAILDTVFSAITLVETAAPATDFPQLTLDWATSNPGGETYYDDMGGQDTRVIVISGQVNVDTDEYDQHVIAHEFGHYIEDRFGRSDSLGGPHTNGDRLDPTVAFGEGFGTAFGAMVLNDPVYRDTTGSGQAQGLSINIESSTVTNPGWYSEASCYEILWDLYDTASDGNDALSLGFAPLWQVLTGAQRNNDAVTSIFSFVTNLKAQNSAQATAINSIVTTQSIVSNTIDIFGSTETNSAGAALASDVLPFFTPVTVNGAAQTVRSIGTFGLSNKLSVVRYLRLDLAAAQNVRVSVVSGSAGRDVDAFVIKRGAFVASGEVVGNETISMPNLALGSYVIAVYDYGNVDSGPAASTPITVTVTSY